MARNAPILRQVYDLPASTNQYGTGSDKSQDFNTLVMKPLTEIGNKLIGMIPDIIVALYTLIFGWLIARFLKFLVAKFLKAIKFDQLSEKIGITTIFNEAEIGITPSQWFARCTFWVVMFISVIMSLDALRLRIVSNYFDQLVYYISSIVSALVIVVLGLFLSVIVSKIIETTAKTLKMHNAEFIAGFMRGGILFFTLLLVLTQFSIPPLYLVVVLGVGFVTMCLTLILAFGFGGQRWANKVLDKWK